MGDGAGLALERQRQQARAVAERLGRHARRIRDERIVADDEIAHALEGAVAWLGRLGDVAAGAGLQARQHRGGGPRGDAAALEHR